MKRKQWLAMILALGMLLSLVPAFSASASELEDGQIIADGIYYIRNWEFNTFLKMIDKKETENYDMYDYLYPGFYYSFHEEYQPPYSNPQTSLTEMDAKFLWKVEYIGNGEYAISSMYITDFMLTPGHELEDENGVPLGAMDYHRDEDGYVPNRFRWIIRIVGQDRYVLQWIGDNGRPFAAEDPDEYPLPFVMGDSPDSRAFEWEFIPAPEQIMFFSAGGTFKENPVCFVAPEQTLTLDELGLGVMLSPDFTATQDIEWSYSDDYSDPDTEDIAWVDSDGSVTGVRYGECTITATYRKEGRPPISKSYTLKVAPLPEGDYFISNRESEKLIDSVWDNGIYPHWLCMNDDFNGMRSQKWTLVHVDKDKYYILTDNLEPELNLFYLAPAEDQTLEEGAPIVIRLVREDSVIPCWTIGVTEDGTYTIKNAKDETLLIQQALTDDEDGEELQQGTATVDDHYDEWEFERANTLRVQVYYDDYVAAYIPDNVHDDFKTVENGVKFIKENHLATTRQFYWEQYKVSIDFLSPTKITTYYDECTDKSYEGICECSDECTNSTDPNDPDGLGEYHHTNISNILLRVPQPEPPVDLTVLFIGHVTCYVGEGDNEHLWRNYKGLIFKEYGLIAVNNIGSCECNSEGHCTCGNRLNMRDYSVESSIKTLIHEIGHFFGAKDHYGDGKHGVLSSKEMRGSDERYHNDYHEECIYGEEKEDLDVLADFTLCEACRNNIADGVWDYFYADRFFEEEF